MVGSTEYVPHRFTPSCVVDLPVCVSVAEVLLPPHVLREMAAARATDLVVRAAVLDENGAAYHAPSVSTRLPPTRLEQAAVATASDEGSVSAAAAAAVVAAAAAAAPGPDAAAAALALYPAAVAFGEVLTLPVSVRDVSPHCRLVLTVVGVDGAPLATASTSLFDGDGKLLTGLQRLRCRPAGAAAADATPNDDAAALGTDPADAEGLALDAARQLAAHTRNERRRAPKGSSWLNALSAARLAQLATSPPALARRGPGGGPAEEAVFAVVEFPTFATPVVYEEKPYHQQWTPAIAKATFTTGGRRTVGAPLATCVESGLAEASAASAASWSAASLLVVPDYELDDDVTINPVEDRYRRLARDQLRRTTAHDLDSKPNRREAAQLSAIVASPNDALRPEERDLVWKFRGTLTSDKRALTKFVTSVDWEVQAEAAQAEQLLQQFRERRAVDTADALKLLGPANSFSHAIVRQFAVSSLDAASDDELLLYLLQLVQALRYEAGGGGGGGGGPDASRGRGGSAAAALLLADEDDADDGDGDGDGDDGDGAALSPLAGFLIARACRSAKLANFFYWYLTVELVDASHGPTFRYVMECFMQALSVVSDASRAIRAALETQAVLVSAISAAQQTARDTRGRKEAKENVFRKALRDTVKIPPAAEGGGSTSGAPAPLVTLPLEPCVEVTGIRPDEAFMFRSALYPAVVRFDVRPPDDDKAAAAAAAAAATAAAADDASTGGSERRPSLAAAAAAGDPSGASPKQKSPTTYDLIFKNGDDLRQDQLVMQMVSLMDMLLKQPNLDLKLTPYRVLATGRASGLMEFVANSMPVSAALTKFGSITEYLRHFNPAPASPDGIAPEAMGAYVKSCAGYCVITYLLGIGDRHLDNLMLISDGRLFHIDFGFILGQDPKKQFATPPPFRLTREMADAMRYPDGEPWKAFCQYCCQSFNWLRKAAPLILSLLALMVDAGLDDLAVDPAAALRGVQDRFRLDLDDEFAESFFLKLISESLGSFAPAILEVFHGIAVKMR